jgi:copper chaperone CopZ
MILKSVILVFTFLFLTLILSTADGEISKTKTIKIKCTEMSCAGCKKKITESIENLNGIKEVQVDLDTKIITVTFDETLTSTDKITDAIASAGYESELIE